ncbi:galactose-binding domain-like protein [Lophiotrema nucula]|uniref:Galactose-binding domain-like protein n=1 Tax=Lophiotrema nucula TaxID=690887 RepID=A0A6A5ZLC9_9PLEO|nr:galactose-binding domain-like protein [Lophiotrema nucula]
MPPSLRRRGQAVPQSPQFDDDSPVPSSDEEEPGIVEEGSMLEAMADEEAGMHAEAEDEDEEPLGSPIPSEALQTSAPIPPNFREISTLASWTVSSSKPGCSIPQLRSPSTSHFWQSDGPQPHWLNIHFFKLVRIVGLRLYLDFEADESYTPTRIVFLAGSGGNDLVEWGEMRLEQPRGWIWADFSGVGDADSDGSDSELDGDDEGEGGDPAIRALTAALEENHSDFENTEPPSAGTAYAGAGAGGDPMVVDEDTPSHQQPQTQTPSAHPTRQNSNTNTSLTRTQPRRPLHTLNPNASPNPSQPQKEKKVKTPVLRAHLVQIRILENHQNGKDTHLRGLQIFAKDDERVKGVRPPRRSIVPVASSGNQGMEVRGARKGGRRVSGGAMRGLAKSEWDVEPSIR